MQERDHMSNRNITRPTEVSSILYKVKKMANSLSLLFSNVIDLHHQNSYLFTNKHHFIFLLRAFIGVLAKFHE